MVGGRQLLWMLAGTTQRVEGMEYAWRDAAIIRKDHSRTYVWLRADTQASRYLQISEPCN